MKTIIQSRRLLFSVSIAFLAMGIFFTLGAGNSYSAKTKAAAQNLSTSPEEDVARAFDTIKSAYESRDMMRMMSCLDKRYEGWLEFKAAIQEKFFSSHELELLLISDTVLTNNNRISVRLHWFRKEKNLAGTFSKTEGSCQFVFKKTGRSLKLLYIRGDNPFF